jgi:hypothetical protein
MFISRNFIPMLKIFLVAVRNKMAEIGYWRQEVAHSGGRHKKSGPYHGPHECKLANCQL